MLRSELVKDAMAAQHFVWPLYTAMKMRCIPNLQKRWLRGRLLNITRRYGQDILRRINGEYLTRHRRRSQRLNREPYDHDQWYSRDDVGSTSHEREEHTHLQYGANVIFAELRDHPLPRPESQSGQLDKLKIDPALLTESLLERQNPTSGDLDIANEVLPSSPSQPEPIPVV